MKKDRRMKLYVLCIDHFTAYSESHGDPVTRSPLGVRGMEEQIPHSPCGEDHMGSEEGIDLVRRDIKEIGSQGL